MNKPKSDKHTKTKSLLTTPSNVLDLHLKQTFLSIIWTFTEGEGEGDGIESRLPFMIFSALDFSFHVNNIFIRCFHRFVSRIYSAYFSQFEQLKKNFFLDQLFFLSLSVEKEIITNIRWFGILNWWNYLMNSLFAKEN